MGDLPSGRLVGAKHRDIAANVPFQATSGCDLGNKMAMQGDSHFVNVDVWLTPSKESRRTGGPVP